MLQLKIHQRFQDKVHSTRLPCLVQHARVKTFHPSTLCFLRQTASNHHLSSELAFADTNLIMRVDKFSFSRSSPHLRILNIHTPLVCEFMLPSLCSTYPAVEPCDLRWLHSFPPAMRLTHSFPLCLHFSTVLSLLSSTLLSSATMGACWREGEGAAGNTP